MATTFADTLSYYAIIGVPAGTYSIFANKDGYDTVKFEGIKVIAGNKTIFIKILKSLVKKKENYGY